LCASYVWFLCSDSIFLSTGRDHRLYPVCHDVLVFRLSACTYEEQKQLRHSEAELIKLWRPQKFGEAQTTSTKEGRRERVLEASPKPVPARPETINVEEARQIVKEARLDLERTIFSLGAVATD